MFWVQVPADPPTYEEDNDSGKHSDLLTCDLCDSVCNKFGESILVNEIRVCKNCVAFMLDLDVAVRLHVEDWFEAAKESTMRGENDVVDIVLARVENFLNALKDLYAKHPGRHRSEPAEKDKMGIQQR